MALSDAAGNVTARLSYSPYGEVTVVSGTPNTPFLFNGQFGVMTEPNGLFCMQARFYSPIYRRFLSEDPAGFSGGINLYGYVSANPVSLIDPFGLGEISATGEYFVGIGEVWRGYGDAGAETVMGLWGMLSNPIGTAQGLYYAGTQPGETFSNIAGAVGSTFADLGSGDNRLAGRAVGRGLILALTVAAPAAKARSLVLAETAAPIVEDTVSLFHQGTLRGGQVSSTRALSTSLSSDLTHYNPAGTLNEFQVPSSTFNEWRYNGLLQPRTDLHLPTGIVTPELQVMPPASGQLNQFLVRPPGS